MKKWLARMIIRVLNSDPNSRRALAVILRAEMKFLEARYGKKP